MGFRVTYEIITPESAEHADVAERGFVEADGFKLDADAVGRGDCEMSLREAARLVSAGTMEDSGYWFSEADPRRNYQTAAEEFRSLHPPENITAASYARLRRLMTGRN
jgi:hypothetical protein